jgi:translation initiation factor IF-2
MNELENLSIPRKQMIKILKTLKIKTNMELNQLDNKIEDFEEKQTELIGTLREIELRLFKTQRNKNNSKAYKFTPSSIETGSIFNRSQRRQIMKN